MIKMKAGHEWCNRPLVADAYANPTLAPIGESPMAKILNFCKYFKH